MPGTAPVRKGYGPTSFWLQDPKAVFDHLALQEGTVLVDAGCGAGEYSLFAADLLGEKGRVIALDTVKTSIEQLNVLALEEGKTNVTGYVCDITAPLPLETGSVDVLMLSTVLHIKSVRDQAESMFSEFKRALRPDGILAVLECKRKKPISALPFIPGCQRKMSRHWQLPAARRHSELLLEHTYLACFQPR